MKNVKYDIEHSRYPLSGTLVMIGNNNIKALPSYLLKKKQDITFTGNEVRFMVSNDSRAPTQYKQHLLKQLNTGSYYLSVSNNVCCIDPDEYKKTLCNNPRTY